MSWVEVFKINSDMSKPLNTYISELISGLTTLVNTVNTNVTNTKTQVGTVNTTANTINTTVNTINTKVQSLDKLIEAQTRIVASDTYYASLNSGSVKTPTAGTEAVLNLPQKIKMTRPGSMRFKGTLTRSSYKNMNVSFFIYKNGTEVYNYTQGADYGTGSDTFSADVSFSVGDVLSFKLTGLSSTGGTTWKVSIDSFTMNGTIVHNVFEDVS